MRTIVKASEFLDAVRACLKANLLRSEPGPEGQGRRLTRLLRRLNGSDALGDAEFLQGFAAAVATLARDHDQPSVAVDIMHGNGVTLDALRSAGVERFDLGPLQREWRIHPKSRAPASSPGDAKTTGSVR